MNSKKKSEQNPIRLLGQQRIDSSLRLGSPIQNAKKDPGKNDRRKEDSISLSEFLDKKIHSSPLPGKIAVKGKSRPFSSPFGSKANAETQHKFKEEDGCKKAIDEVVYEQFKCSGVEIGDQKETADEEQRVSSVTVSATKLFSDGETATSNHKDIKWWNPNDGYEHKHKTQKQSLVLGDNRALKRKGREESSKKTSSKRTQPRYNHYANGSGWWDGEMEGIDAEEVGFGEVWEGVGSMTFGGIDWH